MVEKDLREPCTESVKMISWSEVRISNATNRFGYCSDALILECINSGSERVNQGLSS